MALGDVQSCQSKFEVLHSASSEELALQNSQQDPRRRLQPYILTLMPSFLFSYEILKLARWDLVGAVEERTTKRGWNSIR